MACIPVNRDPSKLEINRNGKVQCRHFGCHYSFDNSKDAIKQRRRHELKEHAGNGDCGGCFIIGVQKLLVEANNYGHVKLNSGEKRNLISKHLPGVLAAGTPRQVFAKSRSTISNTSNETAVDENVNSVKASKKRRLADSELVGSTRVSGTDLEPCHRDEMEEIAGQIGMENIPFIFKKLSGLFQDKKLSPLAQSLAVHLMKGCPRKDKISKFFLGKNGSRRLKYACENSRVVPMSSLLQNSRFRLTKRKSSLTLRSEKFAK